MSTPFLPLSIAIITISDTRTMETDRSGNVLEERVEEAGHRVQRREIVPDEQVLVEQLLRELIEDERVDVVITTGGTGLTGRDITPEAFAAVWEKPIPGFGELFRMLSYEKIGTSTIQSRACAGVANGTFLFALPGSPNACKDGWDWILAQQLDVRHAPCNFAELIPRLRER